MRINYIRVCAYRLCYVITLSGALELFNWRNLYPCCGHLGHNLEATCTCFNSCIQKHACPIHARGHDEQHDAQHESGGEFIEKRIKIYRKRI